MAKLPRGFQAQMAVNDFPLLRQEQGNDKAIGLDRLQHALEGGIILSKHGLAGGEAFQAPMFYLKAQL